MPVINIEDLTEKDKLKMEVDQLKKEVTLERMLILASHCQNQPFTDY
uniref:G protein subunit gamma transducin 1 n=1 Tax=Aotus nancymaae TaxID=37293 RepID=A0A2K5D6T2_AOTNA